MALTDGVTWCQALFKILVPIAVPGFIVTFIMAFMEEWSEFFYAMTLTDQMTLPPTRAGFQRIE